MNDSTKILITVGALGLLLISSKKKESIEIDDITDQLPKNPNKTYSSRSLNQINKIVVHHSATTSGTPLAYANYHINTRDFPGIAYHYVIDKDGTINQTNKLDTVSWHAGGVNTSSIGICLTGNYDTQTPPPEQLQALTKLIAYLRSNMPNTLQVYGHRDFSSKSCPGNNVSLNEYTLPNVAGISKSMIQLGDIIEMKGRKYKIQRGTAKGKKYKAVPIDGQAGIIHFAAKGYTWKPGTKQGDNYCRRSLGIKKRHNKPFATPNDFSRLGWNCRGDKSISIGAIYKTNDCPEFVKCVDGTYSTSKGKGACSNHGGVLIFDKEEKQSKLHSSKKIANQKPEFITSDYVVYNFDYGDIKNGTTGQIVKVIPNTNANIKDPFLYNVYFGDNTTGQRLIKKNIPQSVLKESIYNKWMTKKLTEENAGELAKILYPSPLTGQSSKEFDVLYVLKLKPDTIDGKKLTQKLRDFYNDRQRYYFRYYSDIYKNKNNPMGKRLSSRLKSKLFGFYDPLPEDQAFRSTYACTLTSNIQETIQYIQTEFKEKYGIRTSVKNIKNTSKINYAYEISPSPKYKPLADQYPLTIRLKRDMIKDNIGVQFIDGNKNINCSNLDDGIKIIADRYKSVSKKATEVPKQNVYNVPPGFDYIKDQDIIFLRDYLNDKNPNNPQINISAIKKQTFNDSLKYIDLVRSIYNQLSKLPTYEEKKNFIDSLNIEPRLDLRKRIRQHIFDLGYKPNPFSSRTDKLHDYINQQDKPLRDIIAQVSIETKEREERERVKLLKAEAEKVAQKKGLTPEQEQGLIQNTTAWKTIVKDFEFKLKDPKAMENLIEKYSYKDYNKKDLEVFSILYENYKKLLEVFFETNPTLLGTYQVYVSVFMGEPSIKINYTPLEGKEDKNFLHLDIYTMFEFSYRGMVMENSTRTPYQAANIRNVAKKRLLQLDPKNVKKFFESTTKSIINQIGKVFKLYKTEYLSSDEKAIIEKAKREEQKLIRKAAEAKAKSEREAFEQSVVLPGFLKTTIPLQTFIDARKGTSHTPERGGKSAYNMLNAFYKEAYLDYLYPIRHDQEKVELLNELFSQFKDKDEELKKSVLFTNARQTSTNITGRSNYNVRRHNKLLSIEQNKSQRLDEHREKWHNKISLALQNPALYRGEVTKKDLRDDLLLKQINELFDKDIKNRDYRYNLHKQNIQAKLENRTRKGEYDLVKTALDLIKERQQSLTKPAFTSKSSIWTLLDKAKAKEDKMKSSAYAYKVGEHEHTRKPGTFYTKIYFEGIIPPQMFKEIKQLAKDQLGFYSKYARGFLFENEDNAKDFIKDLDNYLNKAQISGIEEQKESEVNKILGFGALVALGYMAIKNRV